MALFDLMGRRWAMGIVWQLSDGTLTFTELQKHCDSISPTILSSRLKDLADADFVERTLDGYKLTALGEELFAVLQPMKNLAIKWEKTINRSPTKDADS